MQWDTDVTGLAGITLAAFTLLLRQPRVQALPPLQRAGGMLGALIVLSVPLWGLSLTGLLRGFTGDLSMMTLLLLVLRVAQTVSGCALVRNENREQALKAIAIAGALFYPFALGFSPFDPYRLGFGSLWLMLPLLGFAAWAALRQSILLALGIALAVAAWSIGWYESPNLWDYLLDPWLVIYAIGAQAKRWWQQRKETAHV
jgi:hypothetical protein